MKMLICIGLVFLFAVAIVTGIREEDVTSRDFAVYNVISSYSEGWVSVCSNKGALMGNQKPITYASITMKSKKDYGDALAKVDNLLLNFPIGYFDHFGCVSARI